MTYFTTVTIISWETRNWRHADKAVLWCKDYGLEQVMRNMYTGKLYAKERSAIIKKFEGMFTKKTEKFFVGTMCHSCFDTAIFNGKINGMKEKVDSEQTFELIQLDIQPVGWKKNQ